MAWESHLRKGKMKKYILSDESGDIALFEQEEGNGELSVSGKAYLISDYDQYNNPTAKKLFAQVAIKWDGCSHFWFAGEDSENEEEPENDSYYHVCGISDYFIFTRTMFFLYEVMVNHVGIDKISELDQYNKYKSLGILDGCSIDLYED